jgi:hypothetical protein
MAEELENSDTESKQEPAAPQPPPSNLPLIITLAALLVYFAFQTVQLLIDRDNLTSMKRSQDAALQEAQKVQSQFKTLLTKTNELAEKGHAGARMVMESLQRQGLGGPSETPPGKAPDSKPAK